MGVPSHKVRPGTNPHGKAQTQHSLLPALGSAESSHVCFVSEKCLELLPLPLWPQNLSVESFLLSQMSNLFRKMTEPAFPQGPDRHHTDRHTGFGAPLRRGHIYILWNRFKTQL